MSINISRVGEWSKEYEFAVDSEHICVFAEATNDSIPEYLEGLIAPPVFSYIPIASVIEEIISATISPEALKFVIHAEQDLSLHQSIIPGKVLRSKGVLAGTRAVRKGTFLVFRTETRDENGDLVNVQHMTLFLGGVTNATSTGDRAPSHRFPIDTKREDPLAVLNYHVDHNQAIRYAKVSGDHNPIHLDDDYAKSLGLPGLILHGLCTFAFCGRAVLASVCDDDPRSLKRLAARFFRPVFPGQDLVTSLWRQDDRDVREIYTFESISNGEVVIKDGLAEVGNSE